VLVECVADRDATVTSCEPIGLPSCNRLRRDRPQLERAELGEDVLDEQLLVLARPGAAGTLCPAE
jgi:hypothetical protein